MNTNSYNTPFPDKAALSIEDFCRRYSIGRSSAYAEIKAGNLPLRKCRGRSLILIGDAERWAATLPVSNK